MLSVGKNMAPLCNHRSALRWRPRCTICFILWCHVSLHSRGSEASAGGKLYLCCTSMVTRARMFTCVFTIIHVLSGTLNTPHVLQELQRGWGGGGVTSSAWYRCGKYRGNVCACVCVCGSNYKHTRLFPVKFIPIVKTRV